MAEQPPLSVEKAPPSEPKQAGIIVLGRIASSVAEAVVLLVIVRLWGKPDVGVLTALLLVYQTVAPIAAAGFPRAAWYFIPARPIAERRALARRFMLWMTGLGVVAGVVLVGIAAVDVRFPELLSAFKAGEASGSVSLKYLALLALYPITELPSRVVPAILIIEGRAKAAAAVGIVKGIGVSLATMIPVAAGLSLWGVVGCLSAFGAVLAVWLLKMLYGLYRGVEKQPSPVRFSELLRFALPLGATEITSILNNRLDRYLILLAFPAAMFAEYQTGAWQIPFVVTIPYAVSNVYMRRYREFFRDGQPAKAIELWRTNLKKVALIVVPITAVFAVAAEETVELLFTADYLAASPVFRLYAIYTLGRVTAFSAMLVAAGRPELVFRASAMTLFFNAAISIPLLLTVGFTGPALGTVIAFVPEVALYCWYIGRAGGVSVSKVFPFVAYVRVLATAAVGCAVAVLFKLSVDWSAGAMLAVEAAIVLVAFVLLGSATGLITKEDRRFAWDWVRFR